MTKRKTRITEMTTPQVMQRLFPKEVRDRMRAKLKEAEKKK